MEKCNEIVVSYRVPNRATPLAAEGGARSEGVGGIVPASYMERR